MEKLYLEFVQLAIGNRNSLSVSISDADWQRLFHFCKKQAIIGVGFSAVEKLHIQGIECPENLRMKWTGLTLKIENKNALINEQCKKLTEQYGHDGFSTCILKGQGNLLNYPEEIRKRRQCGDIDIWATLINDELLMINDCGIPIAVETGKNEVEYETYKGHRAVIEYVKMLYRLEGKKDTSVMSYHHLDGPDIDGTPTEVHFRPAHLYSPFRNRRLQKWFECHKDECMKNRTPLGFAMPTSSVNVIYQLTHMYKHHIEGGLGIRHIMDYYYALRVWHNDVMECKDLQSQGMWSEGLGTPVMFSAEVISVLLSFGMKKFAAAMMYVLHEVLAMPAHYYICEPNEKEGNKLLAEIMNSGNFGHHDTEKPNMYTQKLQYHIWKFKRTFRLAMSYPVEVLWEPVFRVWRKLLMLSPGR